MSSLSTAVIKDDAEAVKWSRLAADQGVATAQFGNYARDGPIGGE